MLNTPQNTSILVILVYHFDGMWGDSTVRMQANLQIFVVEMGSLERVNSPRVAASIRMATEL